MRYKNLIVTLLLSFFLLSLPTPSAHAKSDDFEEWLNNSFNPEVSDVIKKINKTTKKNWYWNLSDYLLEGEKDSTIVDLETLRNDIKEMKKEVKSIKLPKSSDRDDKKSVKAIQKHLSKALNNLDKDADKLIKKIKKDEVIKTVSERKVEKNRISKVSDEYIELNKRHSINVTKLKLNEFIKIDETLAKNFINKREKEKKKSEEKKRKKKVEAEKQKIEDDYLESIDETTIAGKSEVIIYEVFKDGHTPPNEIVTGIEFNEDENVLTATVKGKDGWSDKSIGLGFYEDSAAVYRSLSGDERIEEVWLTITFPMEDAYGNVDDDEVMATWMSRETMDKINWKNFDYQKLLDVVDGKRIYPHFVQ